MEELGFTGTQFGMTAAQRASLRRLLVERHVTVLHHGDCVGADAQAHEVALELGIAVELHPPSDESRRAYCRGARRVHPARPYLVRNRAIVESTAALVATPRGDFEVRRSGTWTTVRYARHLRARLTVIWPDGRVEDPIYTRRDS